MQRYNIFEALYLSFFSKDLYRDVAKNWGGKTFLYLFMLVFLSWILITFQIQASLNAMVLKNSDQLIQQIPILTIKEGKVITPENRPYAIVGPDKKENLAVIDTTGKFKTLEEAHTSILLTQTQLISRTNANEIKMMEVPADMNMVFNPQTIKVYIQKFLKFLWIPLLLGFVISGYLYRIIQALIYAFIGKLFSAKNLRYDEVLQIAMIAITPAMILATLMDAFHIIFPFELLLYFIITLFYLFFGISANNNPISPPEKT